MREAGRYTADTLKDLRTEPGPLSLRCCARVVLIHRESVAGAVDSLQVLACLRLVPERIPELRRVARRLIVELARVPCTVRVRRGVVHTADHVRLDLADRSGATLRQLATAQVRARA